MTKTLGFTIFGISSNLTGPWTCCVDIRRVNPILFNDNTTSVLTESKEVVHTFWSVLLISESSSKIFLHLINMSS